MNLALKVRLYPTSEQQTLIDKTLGCCRKIYNLMLANRLEFYDRNIKGKDLTLDCVIQDEKGNIIIKKDY